MKLDSFQISTYRSLLDGDFFVASLVVYDFHIVCQFLCWASGGGGASQPTPCPLHGHLTKLLLCITGCELSQSTLHMLHHGHIVIIVQI